MLNEVYPDTVSGETWQRVFAQVSADGPVDITLVSDGGPWAVHDMPCPVCLDRKAIVDLSGGGFGPCAEDAARGWRLVQRKPRWWRKRYRGRAKVAE